MLPRFKILYLFLSSRGVLAEVKRLDQPADVPKHRVYQWLWIDEGRVTPLGFVSMATEPRQQRVFEQASLWFDQLQGELRWLDGRVETLSVSPDATLPPPYEQMLHRHWT